MSTPLVECVPNFSEGRRLDVVEKIVAAVKSISGVVMLDYSSDADHNRSVLTFVGPPKAMEEATFAAIAKAAELIDLNKHEGEHPRIGATDVVPFVPISGITIGECVEMAQRVGKRVGEELNIPVYLYEKAATRPDRQNLATVRKGEFEGLKKEIETNPDRKPDFGPSKLGTAGATVIGARSPLIAYNVFLDSEDVKVAENVAKAVRNYSGGLRYVKGLGMLVEGKAQVSMNLTNYQRTPVHQVVDLIRREASRYGVNVTRSELIGLIPEKALIDTAVWHLQLDDFEEDQILEYRIRAAQEESGASSTANFLDDLAAGTPTPGGGSAAAYSGAMAAGLVAMVARLSMGKKKYEDIEAEMAKVLEKAEVLRNQLASAVQEDSAAYEGVMAAFRLPRKTDPEKEVRSQAIQNATLSAAQVPLKTAGMAIEVLELAAVAAEKGNPNAITDAGSAAALARAAITGAGMNVRINLSSLKDAKAVRELPKELIKLEEKAEALIDRIKAAVFKRGEIPMQ